MPEKRHRTIGSTWRAQVGGSPLSQQKNERRLEEVKKINDSDLYQKRDRIELMRKIWVVGEEEDEERSSDAIGVARKGQRRVSYMEENNVDGVHEKAKRRRRGTCSVSGYLHVSVASFVTQSSDKGEKGG